ncbi:unnamed protein product [Rotaria sordida]|uniref:HAT C-terminal dimerisation domain-containing protein n=1 Tax=Rotaria sordida TaxID=392033 RepID=A0A813VYG5_9BILA|nr:unnamed protein product [Rotaria sordida]
MISKEKGRVGCLIFTNTEKLSRILQGSNCCLQDILCAAETIINYCSRIRVLDVIINMLQIRFSRTSFKLLYDVEKFFLDVSHDPLDEIHDRIQLIIEFCTRDINVEKLKVQAHMISDFFKSVITTKQMKIKQITKMSTICEVLKSMDIGKQMFSEYHKLIKLYLIIPVTTATAERTFNALN